VILKIATKIVLRHDDKILLMRDRNGTWDFPGGGLEGGERLEEGLRRELREELGLEDFTLGPVVHADEWFIEARDLHVIAVFYTGSISERQEHQLSYEHSDARWLTPAEIRQQQCTKDTINALEAMGL
jgi:ADP-ribose pyrophosphatase YjhB (NUDIX family)